MPFPLSPAGGRERSPLLKPGLAIPAPVPSITLAAASRNSLARKELIRANWARVPAYVDKLS